MARRPDRRSETAKQFDRGMLYASVDWIVLVGLAFLMVAALNVVNPTFRTIPATPYYSPIRRAQVGNCVRHDETGKNCATTLLCSSYVKSSGKPAWKCDQVASENWNAP